MELKFFFLTRLNFPIKSTPNNGNNSASLRSLHEQDEDEYNKKIRTESSKIVQETSL